MDIEEIYRNSNALLEGHFLLSSGNHSQFYLQSAKVLENPHTANFLATKLARQIKNSPLEIDAVCSPALGGIIAGFALATQLDKKFIFTERVNKEMTLRRGFKVNKGEKYIICEDIITTGGSALEAANQIEKAGGIVVAFASLANRGFCNTVMGKNSRKESCKLPLNKPLFSLEDFSFEMYLPKDCPLCKEGKLKAYKPGSKGN